MKTISPEAQEAITTSNGSYRTWFKKLLTNERTALLETCKTVFEVINRHSNELYGQVMTTWMQNLKDYQGTSQGELLPALVMAVRSHISLSKEEAKALENLEAEYFDDPQETDMTDMTDMTAPCPHYESMRLYLEDAATHPQPWTLWESKHSTCSTWESLKHHPNWIKNSQYRRKVKEVTKTVTYIEPESRPLAVGTAYWTFPGINMRSFESCYAIQYTWSNDEQDQKSLATGLVWRTKEGAESFLMALKGMLHSSRESY